MSGAPGPIVADILKRAGDPLDAGIRVTMESRFGHDFGRVRVHADSDAAQAASALHAQAWTVGQHLVFGQGQYAPGRRGGDLLLAHELAHVVQQTGAALAASASGEDSLEREAAGAADRVVAGRSVSVSFGHGAMGVQRAVERPGPPVVPCNMTAEAFARKVADHAARHQINPILTRDTNVSVKCRDSQPCDVTFSKLPVTVAVRWRMDVPWAVAGWDTPTGRKACRWVYHCEEGGLRLDPDAQKCLEDPSGAAPPSAPGPPGGTPAPPSKIYVAMASLLGGPSEG